MITKSYTQEEIKAAFWKTFHESGELWFPNSDSEEENTEATDYKWAKFLEHLNQNSEEPSGKDFRPYNW